ncbi:MAG: hypothetical protein M3342_11865 [Bacteroidota bacterium]|nr:hypothetical protein [Flavisolibacter sp.]MDQ3844694.1 hypothetical protein [Bacteroidota bacterium]
MKKSITIIGCLLLLCKASRSQTVLDSVVCRFLIERKELDKTIHSKTKIKEGEFVEKANYFLEKKPAIRLSDSIILQPVIFGCYKSHAPKYLLVEYKVKAKSIFYVYGEDRLLQEINRLNKEILEGIITSRNDNDAAALINYLSLCYL